MVLLFAAFFNFDKIVKIEHEKYSQEWINDGKPKGFFWRSAQCTWLSSAMALQRLSFQWLFTTPTWIRIDSEALLHLKRLRMFVLFFNVGIIVWFVISILILEK
jgi:hypothetical protein